MMPPTLRADEYPAYLRALTTQTEQRVWFTLMTLEHQVLRAIHPVALDGQVDFNDDFDTDVLRRLQAGFYDPDHALRLDSDAPTDGVAGANRLIKATVAHKVEELGRWVPVDVGVFRPSVISRDGARVTIQGQDKACLSLRNSKSGGIKKGERVVTAIKSRLYAQGERFFRFPSEAAFPDRVGSPIPLGGPDDEHQPWKQYRALARRHGYQLFHDGSGYTVLRKYPIGSPLMTWDGTLLTQNVQTETDITLIKNVVVAYGHKTSYRLDAPKSHPFSREKLSVNGVPWENIFYTEKTDLRGAALRAFAQAELDRCLTQTIRLRTQGAPFFHLDPGDYDAIRLAEGNMTFRLGDASIPFGMGDEMTIGFQKTVRNPVAGQIGSAVAA